MPTYTRTTWVNDSSPDIDETNLNNIEAGIDALFNEFDANTILIANADNTPIKLSVAASTFLGRAAADGIAAMTVAAAKTLLAIGIADISDIPGTIASILSDHDKAAHDALNIDADTVDGEEASAIVTLARIIGLVPSLDASGKLILTGTTQIGTKATDLAALWDKTTKIAKADLTAAEFNAANGICGLDASADVPLAQIPDTLTGKDADSVDSKEPGTTAGKLVYLDASAYLALSQIVGNVPALDAAGKLILTGTSQIGTKATDLAALWDKTTKIVKADIDSGEFDVASKIPSLDASVFLTLSQVVGNVPSLDVNGKLVLTGSGQIGTKTADLAELWSKGTLIDNSMIGLNELHAEGSSNFAGPGGVTVTHSLNLANYAPHIIPTADPGGALGEVWITDVAVNSFVVRNSGIAVIGFTWVIHNRT